MQQIELGVVEGVVAGEVVGVMLVLGILEGVVAGEVVGVMLVLGVVCVVEGTEVVVDTGVKVHPIKVNTIKILFLLNNINVTVISPSM